ILVAALCVSAVTFYRDALEFPRSAPAGKTSTAPPTAPRPSRATPPSSTTAERPAPPSPLRQVKLAKGPGPTEPGVLLMASPLRDGSFDVAEMVILQERVSTVRLSPPDQGIAGARF